MGIYPNLGAHRGQKRVLESPGIGVTDCCKLPTWLLETQLGVSEEQCILFTTDHLSSPSPPFWDRIISLNIEFTLEARLAGMPQDPSAKH